MKVVHKFEAGQPIPEGAVYLKTVSQTQIENVPHVPGTGGYRPWVPCWLVWHYFLVEVEA